jgi:uncharacterized protein (TIGR03435 family)
MVRMFVGIGITIFAPGGLSAQSATAPPAFEVASVKPVGAESGRGRDFRVYPGGRLSITNLPLKLILQEAYSVKQYQLSGGPAWIETDRFDIEAKAEGEPSRAQMMTMLQTLLADRFALKVHRESREGNVYALVVAKGGPKLKESTAQESFIRLYRNTPVELPGVDYTLGGQKASMALFADRLNEQLHRPVLDRTGLTGEYDFKVRYATDDNPETGPPLLVAIQEQLGLKLESTKGLIETLVIDHVEKPSGN